MSKTKKNQKTDDVLAKDFSLPGRMQTVKSADNTISLSDAEADKLRNFEQVILRLKIQLAETEMASMELSQKKNELAATIKEKSNDFMNAVKEMALNYGINPDDTSGAKWNLNTSDMKFNKVQ